MAKRARIKGLRKVYCGKGHSNVFSYHDKSGTTVECTVKKCGHTVIIPAKVS